MNSKINMRIRHNRKARSTSGYTELTRQITGERKSKKERNKHMPWTLTDKHFIAGLVEEGCAVSGRVMITTNDNNKTAVTLRIRFKIRKHWLPVTADKLKMTEHFLKYYHRLLKN